jgi:transcriptional regulator with XRE-family HTH domain
MELDVGLLGARLMQIRQLHGMSLSGLAGGINISKSYLAKLERGQVENPGVGTLDRIAQKLGISLATLFAPATGSHTRPRWSAVVDPLEAEDVRANLPPGLGEFLARIEQQEGPLPADTIVSLGRLRFQGKRPRDPRDWEFVYEAINRCLK